MKLLVNLLRTAANLKMKVLRRAIIQDIPTEQFNNIIRQYQQFGWNKTYEYGGFDAWIDYGRVDLRKGFSKLRFEWDNWCEGEVQGPRRLIAAIAQQLGLACSHSIKWHFN